MNVSKLFYSLVLLCCLPAFSFAQNNLIQVKLYPGDKDQRSQLFGLLGIDHFMPAHDGGIETEISENDFARLKKSQFKYKVTVPNVSRRLDSVNQLYYKLSPNQRAAFDQAGSTVNNIIPTPADFQVKGTSAGYYRFAEMEAAMDALVAKYPTIASKTSIGKTYNNRDIWVIKISDSVGLSQNEPQSFFMGLQHAREAITGASMIFFMQYLCEQYFADPKIKDLVDNREIYIIPCFNPDGWEYNFSTNPSGGGGWRKNRRPTTGGNFGTDLNRNWGKDWGTCDSATIFGSPVSCGSTDPTQDTYIGPYRFSEQETYALRNFTITKRFLTAFDQHAYGPYYSLPFGRKSLHNTPATDMSPKDSNFYKVIPSLMSKYNGMRAADSYDALGYEVAGGFKDWMLTGDIGTGTKDSVWGLTGEGAAGGGNTAFGSYASFWAPASQIINLCKGMCYQNVQLALAAGSYTNIEDVSDLALTTKTGSMTFNLQRIGLTNAPVTVSLIPMENMVSGGTPATIASMTYYQAITGTVGYTLPAAITAGQRVKFAWKVVSGGITYYDTVVKFFNPTPLFYDNMEGTLTNNWTNPSGAGASGFGYNYTSGTWQYTTGGFSGTKALSESAAGVNYTTTTRSIVQCKTIFNLLDATAAYVTFWVRHRAENFRDKLQLQMSTNGTSWTPVSGKTTVKEPGTLDDATLNGEPSLTGIRDIWTQEEFNLDAFRGNNTVYLRLVFTSDDDPSTFKFELDDGFYIDELKVFKSSSNLITLPSENLKFAALLLSNKDVALNWVNNRAGDYAYYEVQHSYDGNTFQTIGRVDGADILKFTDRQPEPGVNYYRLKQVDKDGQMIYSKTIPITIKEDFNLSAYPNPATDKIQLQLSAVKPGKINIQVADATGRQVFRQELWMNTNSQELSINIKSWPSQIYLVKATNATNEVIGVQRFIKK